MRFNWECLWPNQVGAGILITEQNHGFRMVSLLVVVINNIVPYAQRQKNTQIYLHLRGQLTISGVRLD
jgi:hypothetical protein